MIQPGTTFTPGTPLSTDINSALAQTQANLDGIYPSNPSTEDYPLPQSVRNYLAKATVTQVNDAIITATNAWAAATNDRNVNNSTRHAVWTSNHGTVETNVLDNYFLHGKPWPTNAVIKSVITGSATGTTPGIPMPVVLPGTALNGQIVDQVNANSAAIYRLQSGS
jgi:hypothetical protein